MTSWGVEGRPTNNLLAQRRNCVVKYEERGIELVPYTLLHLGIQDLATGLNRTFSLRGPV